MQRQKDKETGRWWMKRERERIYLKLKIREDRSEGSPAADNMEIPGFWVCQKAEKFLMISETPSNGPCCNQTNVGQILSHLPNFPFPQFIILLLAKKLRSLAIIDEYLIHIIYLYNNVTNKMIKINGLGPSGWVRTINGSWNLCII